MKKLMVLFFMCITYNCFAQQKTDTLTNSDVVKLIKSKLPESIIAQKISASNCRFDISVEGLIKLKENSVTDNLISIIVKRQIEVDAASAALSMESKVEYRVTAGDKDAKIILNYRDDREQFLGSSGQSGWIYTFKTNRKPFTCLLSANLYPTKILATTVTITILVNDIIVATKTGIIKIGQEQQIQFVIN